MAFRATRLASFIQRSTIAKGPGLPRNDVAPSMAKWWKSYKHTDGLVTQHVSSYEQQALVPWVRDWPNRLYTKFSQTAMDWVPAFIAVYAIVEWSEYKHHEIAHHHRD